MTSIEADVAFAPEAARVQAVSARGTRGRRQHPLTQIRRPLSGSWRAVLGAVGVSSLVVLWLVAASSTNLVPTPLATWHAVTRLWRDGVCLEDVRASSQRIAIGYGISVVLGV